MGILKAKVGGTWVDLIGMGAGPPGPAGAPGPAGPAGLPGTGGVPDGGVLGDILVKQSATNGDVLWAWAMPKLNLTSVTSVALASTSHALTLGISGAANLALGADAIQARSNGVAATLNINALGGTVNIGTGAANSRINLGSSGTVIVGIGDDAYFQDLNITNGLAIRGVSNAGFGWLAFGNNTCRLGYDGEFRFQSGGAITFTNSAFQVLNAAGSAWLFNHNGTRFWVPGDITTDNTVSARGVSVNGDWVRVYGNQGLYLQDRGVGWCSTVANVMEMYGGSHLAIPRGHRIRFSGPSDGNHELGHTGATPTSSGIACDGPIIVGFSSVWLHTQSGDKQLLLYSNGNAFLSPGGSWTVLSSREYKDNITTLDPERCLDTVKRWRPVEYDFKDDGRHAQGFIAEEMLDVTPEVVTVTGPDDEIPNWPNGIDYGGLAPHLAGAIQALTARIEQLESRAA